MAKSKTESPLLDEIAQESVERREEREQLLAEIVQAGREPTFDEAAYFSGRFGWDWKTLGRQLNRKKQEMLQRQIAGTPEDRDAVAKRLEKARKTLQGRGQAIAQEIEKLQTELRQLERDEASAAKTLDDMHAALARLRDLAPEDVKAAVLRQKSVVKDSIGRQYHEAANRLNHLECLTDVKRHASPWDHLQALRLHNRKWVIAGDQQLAYSPEWQADREDMLREIEELRPEVERLKAEFDAALADAEKPLDAY